MDSETITINGKEYKLGPIMPPEALPVHVGWYLRCFGIDPADPNHWRSTPDYWDGERWMLCDSTGHVIARSPPLRHWRGLAEPSGLDVVPPPQLQEVVEDDDQPGFGRVTAYIVIFTLIVFVLSVAVTEVF